MILIENKLDIFEDIVYKSRLLELQAEKDRLIKEKEKLREEKQKIIDQETEEAVNRRVKLAQVIGNEEIAKAKEQKRILQLKKMSDLEKDLLESIRQRAREFTQSPAYEEILIKDVKSSFGHLEPGLYQLGLTKRDMDLYFEKIQKIANELRIDLRPLILEDKAIGGHVLTDANNTYNLNNDLYTRIDEKKYEIGRLLHNLFKEEAINE